MAKYSKTLYAVPIAVLASVGIALWKGVGSFLFAWVFHLMFMMVVLSVMEAAMPKLRSRYFSISAWESDGRIYERLGVNLFRKILVWIGWEKLNKKNNTVEKSVASLQHIEYLTRQAEFGHLLILCVVTIMSIVIIMIYDFSTAFWLLILNIILHLYPIIVQRYNRPRFQKTIEKLRMRAII